MFSGIIEAKSTIQAAEKATGGVQISVEKPSHFDDLEIGASVALNGICLTVERFDSESVVFTLAAETLQVTQWKADELIGKTVNLERSLKYGSRVHGHLVTGHVDEVTTVVDRQDLDGSVIFWITKPPTLSQWIWKKGCVCLNGVSLTVNEVQEDRFSVCLIPETLRQTHLSQTKPGDLINIEADYFAKAIIHGTKRQ